MHIVIPMTGIGRRFLEAGYADPKPLIQVDGMPIIEHVVNMFPGEHRFTFICNRDHLATTPMRSILERIAPQGRILELGPHGKGPVYAVAQIISELDDDEEVIVNYCDFSCMWDYRDFLNHTHSRNADGAVPAYRGFHPHMLGTTNYAFLREENQWMLEIKEKEPFTENRMNEFASSGTYYFKHGHLIKRYFQELIDLDINLKGEYYVSLVYNLLKRDGLKISIYEIEHMLQWGMPADLEEYQRWSAYFEAVLYAKPALSAEPNSTVLIPMAGAGNRFVQDGYSDPKPLIMISGKPMILQATFSLPKAERYIFACLGSHLDRYPLSSQLEAHYSSCSIVRIDTLTQGQACTCELAMQNVDPEAPLLIAACDNGMIWDQQEYDRLRRDPGVDAIAWTFRHHPSSRQNPHMYGWVPVDDKGRATGCSVKVPISDDPFNDHAIVGSFYFKKARTFLDALASLYRKDQRVNGEFYVDSAIAEMVESGLDVRSFEVDHYICWGTPNDLRTFQYWQRFFDRWPYHPYSINSDPTVDAGAIDNLNREFDRFAHGHNSLES